MVDQAGKPEGAKRKIQNLLDRPWDRWTEWRLGIRAQGFVTTESLGIARPGNHDYKPTSVRSFHLFMRELDEPSRRGVFVDYGSGMGRILALAALYPFRRVIGVELSSHLTAIARENLQRCAPRLACRDVEIWPGDAASFPVPDDATVIFLFNPFHGEVLSEVFARLQDSIVRRPRRIYVIFNNPVHFKKIAHRFPWLVPQRRFDFDFECIVYRGEPVTATNENTDSTPD